ncbi:UDP-galactose transporter senju [Contarinia nasturtii]|uniref:UDP-galactose transporter senju n=1 Tax=Contarinia nasturtii TaxID=265458 RepID=UPI0012D45A2E|nr:UDP-galactose transporter senju [Contarinia nasturtii]
MGGIIWSEVFPTKTALCIFVAYMSLFISQGILVTASQDESSNYSYNTICVVLITELVKLIASVGLYCRSDPATKLVKETIDNKHLLLLYFIPSLLYCIYNNLTFKNLSTFDPTTYYLLLQFRVVITGVLFQVIFHKILTRRQWFSLLLLTLGCMVKQLNFGDMFSNTSNTSVSMTMTKTDVINTNNAKNATFSNKNTTGFDLSIDAVYIFIQLICSCLAGVYNEYLLKNVGARVNIYVQNVFMYVDSIVCNVVLLILQGNSMDAINMANLKTVFTFNVIIIILNNAAIGIVTSFFLRYLNSILKTFASALELLFTAILCYLLFNIPIHTNTTISIAVVSFAIYFYSLSPVINNITNNKRTKEHDECPHESVELLKDNHDIV